MLEGLAEVDDAIMELYLADEPVPMEMIQQALRQGTVSLADRSHPVRHGL